MEVMKIGAQVKRERVRALMTQQELAERAGIGLTTLNRIENDHAEPQFRTIRKAGAGVEHRPGAAATEGVTMSGKLAIYERVSSEEQRTRETIATQDEFLGEYVAASTASKW